VPPALLAVVRLVWPVQALLVLVLVLVLVLELVV
jgi:hypothetical protein